MSTVITVTAEHIAQGQQGECEFCPIALAFRDALPDFDSIDVHLGSAWITPADGWGFGISLPEEADDFIEAFDQGRPVQPFSFTADYPEAAA